MYVTSVYVFINMAYLLLYCLTFLHSFRYDYSLVFHLALKYSSTRWHDVFLLAKFTPDHVCIHKGSAFGGMHVYQVILNEKWQWCAFPPFLPKSLDIFLTSSHYVIFQFIVQPRDKP